MAGALLFTSIAIQASPAATLNIAEVKQIVRDAVEKEKRAPGIVVGLIDQSGTQVIAWGKRKFGAKEDVDGDTIFEIGSITKIFTSVLLQDMADHGEVKLDDPIGKFLPASVKTPTRKGREITLLHLATHTSGLPRLPFSFWYALAYLDDPYAKFTVKDFYKFLSHYKLRRDIGAEFEYSNAGMQLLGLILSLKAGTNYESLVVNRICAPLKMDSTRITLSADQKSRFATGHDETRKPVKNWDQTNLPGDGALRSSVNDLLKFLSVNLGLSQSSLSGALAAAQVPRHVTDDPSERVGLGWIIETNSNLIWHNGETRGYSSYIAFNKSEGRGVVILANAENNLDDLGEILAGVRQQHWLAQIDYQIYNRYVGKYQYGPKIFVAISRDGDRLFSRMTGQDKLELFPESETEFFYREINEQITFTTNQTGVVTGMILHQHGKDHSAPKLK